MYATTPEHVRTSAALPGGHARLPRKGIQGGEIEAKGVICLSLVNEQHRSPFIDTHPYYGFLS